MSDEQVPSFIASDLPYGRNYVDWTVEWWRWILGIPKRVNPVVDSSGEYTTMNQQNRDVFFLAGKLAEEDGILPERSCNVSVRKSILVPVINCEANLLEYPELKTDMGIINHVKNDEDTIVLHECYLDGKEITAERISSGHELFEVKLVEDNLFDVGGGGITRASVDGYWVFLKPLPRGKHTISFQGSCEMGRLHSGAIYRINVD
jgi:hypothetical protein